MTIFLLGLSGTGLFVGLALLWSVADARHDKHRDMAVEVVMATAGLVCGINSVVLMSLAIARAA